MDMSLSQPSSQRRLTILVMINLICCSIHSMSSSSHVQTCYMGHALALEKAFNDDPVGVFQQKPLFGVPFSVKDNFDVAGYPTTAGCPDFVYTPWTTAFAIKKLQTAGAVLIGKCNMDQFATGLVGVRTPYGIPVNPFQSRYCPGGSSSGSGVAVATGLCSFSIGTDTAGSGRIPAAFNNIVGLKPTKGWISTHGMVPACRSLDCSSVFALTVDDAWQVANIAKGFDTNDEYSIREPSSLSSINRKPRFGIPKDVAFFGDTHGARELFNSACEKLQELTGGTFVEIPFEPFTEVARILYEGPWVAQRLSVIKDFLKAQPNSVLPITRSIISRGDRFSAVDLFIAERHLEHLRRQTELIWQKADLDVLLVPTASITPTIQETSELPIAINTMLGYYTNFVNLLNMSALAVPNGFLPSGMPSGVSFIGQAWQDRSLAILGKMFQQARDLPLGASPFKLSTTAHGSALPSQLETDIKPTPLSGAKMPIVVVGAHLSGMPLNSQLTSLQASFVSTTKTAPLYRLYDISKGTVARPGLVRVPESQGRAFEVEVWNLPTEHYGRFIENITPPLALGNVVLENGSVLKGFLCESYVVPDAKDISDFSGWRSYVSSKQRK